jgi:hypothetical protein
VAKLFERGSDAVDERSAGATVGGDPQVGAVAEVDGAAHGGRQAAVHCKPASPFA